MSKLEDVVVETNRARVVRIIDHGRGSLLNMGMMPWKGEDPKILGDAYLEPEEALAVAKALVASAGVGAVVEGELPEVELAGFETKYRADGVYREVGTEVEDLDNEILALLAIRAEIVRRKEADEALKAKRYKVTESLGSTSWALLTPAMKQAVDRIIEQEDRIKELEDARA